MDLAKTQRRQLSMIKTAAFLFCDKAAAEQTRCRESSEPTFSSRSGGSH